MIIPLSTEAGETTRNQKRDQTRIGSSCKQNVEERSLNSNAHRAHEAVQLAAQDVRGLFSIRKPFHSWQIAKCNTCYDKRLRLRLGLVLVASNRAQMKWSANHAQQTLRGASSLNPILWQFLRDAHARAIRKHLVEV